MHKSAFEQAVAEEASKHVHSKRRSSVVIVRDEGTGAVGVSATYIGADADLEMLASTLLARASRSLDKWEMGKLARGVRRAIRRVKSAQVANREERSS